MGKGAIAAAAAAGSAPVDDEWQEKRLRAIVAACVTRNMGMFSALGRIVSDDDMISEGVVRVLQQRHTYKPAKARPSTFIQMVVKRRMMDECRRLTREAAREQVARVQAWANRADPARPALELDARPTELRDWLVVVYAACKGCRPRPSRRGPKGYAPAVRLAVALLIRRMKLSTRGAELLLGQRSDLRQALGMTRVPSQWWFVHAAKYLSDNSELAEAAAEAGSNNGA